MDQKHFKLKFPSKKVSPTTSKREYIDQLQDEEQLGWTFLQDYQDETNFEKHIERIQSLQ